MRTYQLALIAALMSGAVLPDSLLQAVENASTLSGGKTLEQRVADLESRAESSGPIRDGFIFKSADGENQIRFSPYVQADGRTFMGDDSRPAINTFFLRRVRPIISGSIERYYNFYFDPDFGQETTVIQDAYLENAYWPQATLRAGKFKTPLGLERLLSDPNNRFAELALPTNLAPNRDIGAQLSGQFHGGNLSYQVGVFNGNPDNTANIDTDSNDQKDLAARIFIVPFKGLGTGLAATYGRESGALPSFKTTGGQTVFAYNTAAVAGGDRIRISPQSYYYAGPFGFLGEYIQSAQEVRVSGALSKVKHSAWQSAASFLLTGEKALVTGVTPTHPFDPAHGGWGAFELAARYSELNVDDDAFTRKLADPAKSVSRAQAWAVGINWYLTKHVKYVLNFERTNFTGGEARGDREAENVLVYRLQLAI